MQYVRLLISLYFLKSIIVYYMAAVDEVELADSSSKNVLILCQRKTGKCSDPKLQVENTIVVKINEFVSTLFPRKTVNIEYLTDGIRGECNADHCIRLDGDAGTQFSESHREHYDVVILNTCPFILMNFVMIHQILKNNGLMIFKAYNCSSDDPVPQYVFNMMSKGDISLREAIDKYFTAENEHFVFRKKTLGGRRRKSRKRKSRRSKKIY